MRVGSLLVAAGLAVFTAECSHAECTGFCNSSEMPIYTTNDAVVVSASDSCGQEASCAPTGCAGLWLAPPPQGGVCMVTITLVDAGTINLRVDWGAPDDTPCCGRQYANHPFFELDAGVPDGPSLEFPDVEVPDATGD